MSRELRRNAVLTAVLVIATILTLSAAAGSVQFFWTDGLKASAEKGSDHDDESDGSSSGRGGGSRDGGDDDELDDDDRQSRINRLLAAPQDLSAGTVTAITIPVDAESHSAINPYTPNPATVSSGSTVTWFNADDEDQHSATADDGSFSTGILSPGQSGKAVITAEPGATVPYHCDIHPEMIGMLTVAEAVGGNAQNTTSPQQPAGLTSPLLAVSALPVAVGNYTTVTEENAGNTTFVTVAGNTSITLPNATETITASSAGNFTVAFTGAGGIAREGEIHLTSQNGTEEATIELAEFFQDANSTGIGVASFSANPAGRLALLDNFVAITLDAGEQNGTVLIQFLDWQSGINSGPGQNQSAPANPGNDAGGNNQTATPPAANPGGETVAVAITQGASSKGANAFSPSSAQIKVGDTVVWTNEDATPHTVTSGSNGQPDGNFDSSPNLSPLMASGQTFEHAFGDAGQYSYYCQLHPNMVGTVSVS